MKGLLIAEKPSLMKSIQAVYLDKRPIPDQLDFACFRGHCMALAQPEAYNSAYSKWNEKDLPIIPQVFKFEPTDRQLVNKLNSMIKNGNYDYVINACDAGREGELIFHAFYGTYQHKLPVKRFWASDTTDVTIEKALKNLISPKDPAIVSLQESARFRVYMDWLYGMNFSRALSLASNHNIPTGRVMTPTLKIIVDREHEIRNFKPEDYFELSLTLEKDGESFCAHYLNPPDYKSSRVDDKTQVEAVKKALNEKVKVRKVESKKVSVSAPTLYSLLELQKDANKFFGYKSSKTLEIAQRLYEERKLITYPRTESRYLPKAMVADMTKHLKALGGIQLLRPHLKTLTPQHITYILSQKTYVDDAKVTDHHAIIVTTQKPKLEALSKDEENIYLLIAKRFLSIFLPPYVVLKTEAYFSSGKHYFKTLGKIEKQAGFTSLYPNKSKDVQLPDLVVGDRVSVLSSDILSKQTTPPPRYNDSSILDAMQNAGRLVSSKEQRTILKESAGLGTSATRAGILDKLEYRKWIKRTKKTITPTEDGITVIDVIGNRDIVSPSLTAVWEKKLRDIEDLKPSGDFEKELFDYITSETQSILKETRQIERKERVAIGTCPECQHPIYSGKKSYYCEKYKDTCHMLVPKVFLEAKISEKDLEKLLNGEKIKKKITSFGKKEEKSLQIINGKLSYLDEEGHHPELGSYVKNKNLPLCPLCQGQMTEGDHYYICEHFPKNCKLKIKKVIFNQKLDEEDIIHMLNGKQTKVYQFTWKNGKKGPARAFFKDGRVQFDFKNID